MNSIALLILRIGLGATFIWIGVYIYQAPEAWGNYLMPWARNILPIPIKELMLGTAILDIGLGVLFLIGKFTRIAGLVAAIHLTVVLITSGINAITVRDIGLLGAALFFFLNKK